MLALEVSMNGEPLYTVSSAGEFGSVSFNLVWARVRNKAGPIVESAFVFGHATDDVDDAAGRRQEVKAGDEITVRLVELGADKPDA